MNKSAFESIFQGVRKKTPAGSQMQAFRDHPDRQGVIDFLVGKLEAHLTRSHTVRDWDAKDEWGCVNACRLLGEFKATEAVLPMIEILDDVKNDYMAYIYSAILIALEDMGPEAVEQAYPRYERDRGNPEHMGVWVNVLARAGVRDERIPPALLEYLKVVPAEAVGLIGSYGDAGLLPVVEEFTLEAARRLNETRTDPFEIGPTTLDPRNLEYIEARASLVRLQESLPFDHPEFMAKVEAIDRRLLQYSVFGPYDPSRPSPEVLVARAMGRKIGRNEPCPCGSGKKYKRCCGQ